jgi:hypothetical protein
MPLPPGAIMGWARATDAAARIAANESSFK